MGWKIIPQKLKPLRPSHREKKRYILSEKVSKEEIKLAFARLFGNITLAKAGIILINHKDTPKGYILIRINHKYTDHLKTTLTFINKKTKKTGGTIKTAVKGG